jgi:hypothetical protein
LCPIQSRFPRQHSCRKRKQTVCQSATEAG